MRRPQWLLLMMLAVLLFGGAGAYLFLQSSDPTDGATQSQGNDDVAPQVAAESAARNDRASDSPPANGLGKDPDASASGSIDTNGNSAVSSDNPSGTPDPDDEAAPDPPPDPDVPPPSQTEEEPKGRTPDVVIGKAGVLVLDDWSIRLAINREGSRFAGCSKTYVFVYENEAKEPAWRSAEVKGWSVLAMHPDGGVLVYLDGELRLTAVRLDATKTPWKSEVLWSDEPDEDRYPLVRFSADGARLFLARDSGGVRVLDPMSGELRQTLDTGGDAVYALHENAVANLLATVQSDGRLDVWALDTLEHLRTVQVGKLAGPDLVVEDDGSVLIEFEPGKLARHSSTDGQRMAEHDFKLNDGISHLHKLPGHRLLMIKREGIGSTLAILDTQTFAELHSVPESMTVAVAISGNAKRMVTSTIRNELQLWRIEGDRMLREVDSGEQFLWAAWMPDGRRFLTAGADGKLVSWDADTHTRLESWQLGDRPIDRILVAPGGNSVLAVRDGAESTLLNFLTGEKAQLPLSDWGTQQFSSDGSKLWILTREGIIEFDGATGGRLKVLLPEHRMTGFVVNPSQTVLVCAETSLVAIDLPFTGGEVTQDDQRELPGLGELEYVQCMQFTRDGKTFIMSLYEQVVIADVASEKPLASIKAHLAEVDVDEERGRLLLADLSDKVALYDMKGELIELLATDNGHCAQVSPDGRSVIGVGRNRTLRIWKLD